MKLSPLMKVLLAIFLGLSAGLLTYSDSIWLGIPLIEFYGLMRDLFLNALKLIMVPLVVSSIIVSVSNMSNDQSVGRLSLKALLTFALTTLLAVLVGWALVTILNPGAMQKLEGVSLPQSLQTLTNLAETSGFGKFRDLFLRIVPSNIIEAARQANMLALIAFSLLFGFSMTQIVNQQAASTLRSLFLGIFQVTMRITHIIMKALPFGVFGMIAHVTATTGWAAIQGAGFFFCVVVAGLLLFFPVLFALIYLYGGVNPFRHFKAMFPALVTGFTTSSSAATLPVTLECLEERVGISNRIASFVAALGTSMNLAGSALFMIVASLYLAQTYGIALTPVDHLVVIVMTLFLSFGIGGVPSGALIALLVILEMLHIPAESISLIIAVERFLDMCRTPTSIFTCSCSTLLVALSEGEKPHYSTPGLIAEDEDLVPFKPANTPIPHTGKDS